MQRTYANECHGKPQNRLSGQKLYINRSQMWPRRVAQQKDSSQIKCFTSGILGNRDLRELVTKSDFIWNENHVK